MGKCEKHGVNYIQQDVGRGKWIPICPQCESERKAALASAFASTIKKEHNDGDIWMF